LKKSRNWQFVTFEPLDARMNCRGVSELVGASAGLLALLINAAGFTILGLIALAPTTLTRPLV
jgi:hypothetical protein